MTDNVSDDPRTDATRYRYPDTDPELVAHRTRIAWHEARIRRDTALRELLDAVRDEVLAELEHRAAVLTDDRASS